MSSFKSLNDPEAVESVLRNSCVWELPDAGRTLELPLRIVEWLNYAVIQGLDSSVMGAEVGGLLLGRAETGKSSRTIIDGFTPIACEHASGYTYHLSSKDKSVLKRQLGEWAPSPDKHLYVVGFYRTHNRVGFSLDAEDLALADEFFSEPSQVLLLIKPIEPGNCAGGIFHRRKGRFHPDFPLRFPFSSSELAAVVKTMAGLPGAIDPLAESPVSAKPAPEPTPATKQQAPVASSPESPSKSAALTETPPPAPIPVREKLPVDSVPVKTAPMPKQERVDQFSNPIAGSARMEKHQGSLKKDPIHLWQDSGDRWESIRKLVRSDNRKDVGQWRWLPAAGLLILVLMGAAFFVRGKFASNGVNLSASEAPALNLKVEKKQNLLYLTWNPESSVVRSARSGIMNIVDGSENRTLVLDASQLHRGSVAYDNRTTDLIFRLRVVTDGTETSEWVRVVGLRPISGSATQGRFEVKPFARGWSGPQTAKSSRKKEADSAALLAAPVARGAQPIPHNSVPFEAISGVTAEGSKAGNASSTTDPASERLLPSEAGNTALPASAPESTERTNYTAPQPTYTVEPFVRRKLRPLVPPGLRIQVKVQIDERGNVTRAEPVDQGKAYANLTNLALDAARKWRFTAARLDDRKVRSELTLEFDFDRYRK